MAKLINILAVSLGSGLVLGAGIRALDSRPRTAGDPESDPNDLSLGRQRRLLSRLDSLEARLSNLEPGSATHPGVRVSEKNVSEKLAGSPLAAICARLDAHESEADAILARVSAIEKNIARANESTENLALELRDWAASDIRRQIIEVESRLAANLDSARRESLEIVVEGVQHRVAERIARLEEEVVGQAAAMVELRECSVKTEQSIQKLLVGIDRLVTAQTERSTLPPSEAKPPEPSNAGEPRAPEPAPPPTDYPGREPKIGAPLPRRKWGIFG